MAASALPQSGDLPTGAKTCDASGMAEIHRMFRAGFGEAPDLVRAVSEGDAVHAAAVADQLDLLSATLHVHHEGEDERLWDALTQRAPGCAAHVDRMRAQHAQMLVHLDELDAALPAWRASGAAADATAVLAALDGVNEALAVHLGDEERTIVPVMETTLSQPEVEWFGEHGRKHTPKGKTWFMLGAILRAQPDGGDAWLKKHMPPPGRLAWRLIGRPKYERYRAGLEGR